MSAAREQPVPLGSRALQVLRDWRLLAALLALGCVMVIAITAIGFSSAYFTAVSSSPRNAIAAGTLRMQLSQTAQILNGAGFAPGVTRQGDQTVTLLNGRGELHLSATGASGDTGLASILEVTITQTSPGAAQQLYTGRLGLLQNVDLGSFWAPEHGPSAIPQTRTYRIQMQWPTAASDPSNQGKTISFNFDWQMTSS